MSYTPNTWVDRIAVGDNKFTDQNGNNYEFTPNPDSVSQAGTPFSAAWMNHIENGIADAVPQERTINGYDLSANRTLTANDVGAVSSAITTLSVVAASSSFTLNRGWAHKIGRVVYYSAYITIGSSALSASGALVRFGDERPITSGVSQNYVGIGEYSGTAFSTGWNVSGTHPWMTVNATIPANSDVFVSGSFVTAT